MSKYHCERCNFSTNNRTKFQRHLETKKHKESPFSHHLVTKKPPFLTKKRPKNDILVNIAAKHSNSNRACIDMSNTIVRKARTKTSKNWCD